ncbi:general stress protein CsbD [Pseudoflavitalea rhizosphaerae]|uniref:general stress protein CsbD n=1 Tax=Pseudoflavitalea rhizosphaerae TaxID=1884793 RepID=UPI000F8CFD6E|nr:general stress protein CsbD [Pseudoflavitalea rhizosphaerae]
MASFNLKPGTNWDEVKERIKERNIYLTDEDLFLEPGKEDVLLKRLAEKMDRTPEQVRVYIESVSHNKDAAS